MAGGRRRPGAAHEEHADERWLLTYADMITLLMALFMVLFAMSVVNKSKLASLQESLHNAFSPHVVPGGQAIKRTGGDAQTTQLKPQSNPGTSHADAKAAEDRELRRLKHEVDHEARKLGMAAKVKTHVTRRGLVIDILTDNLLFD